MNKKILDILEFDKVKRLFENPIYKKDRTRGDGLAALAPTDERSIELAFMELEDMEQILLEELALPCRPFKISNPVAGKRFAGDGGGLNIDELLALSCPSGKHDSSF